MCSSIMMNDGYNDWKSFAANADAWSSFVLFVPRIRAHFIYSFHYLWFHLQHQQNSDTFVVVWMDGWYLPKENKWISLCARRLLRSLLLCLLFCASLFTVHMVPVRCLIHSMPDTDVNACLQVGCNFVCSTGRSKREVKYGVRKNCFRLRCLYFNYCHVFI